MTLTWTCPECGSNLFSIAGDKFNGDGLRARCDTCGHQEPRVAFTKFVELQTAGDSPCSIDGCPESAFPVPGTDVALCDKHEHFLSIALTTLE